MARTFCEKCGEEAPEDGAYCESCGSPLPSAEDEASAKQRRVKDVPQRRRAAATIERDIGRPPRIWAVLDPRGSRG